MATKPPIQGATHESRQHSVSVVNEFDGAMFKIVDGRADMGTKGKHLQQKAAVEPARRG